MQYIVFKVIKYMSSNNKGFVLAQLSRVSVSRLAGRFTNFQWQAISFSFISMVQRNANLCYLIESVDYFEQNPAVLPIDVFELSCIESDI